MTSTTPSYLKRAGQGRPARRAYAQWRAEQRRVLPCFARALVYAPAPLFFFLASGAPQEQVCAVVLYPALSLSNTRFLRALPFFLSSPPFRLSSTLFRFRCLVRSSFSPSYLLHLRHLFSLHAHTPDLCVDSETS